MDGGTSCKRVDSLGHFVYKYSDDNGLSWSSPRCELPIRLFQCDRENVYGGKLCYFWNVGHPFIHEGSVYVTLNKIGKMSEVGFFHQDEGVLLKSPDLLTVDDPAKASWETLPDGDIGLRTPPGGGLVAEEHNILPLSDGSFYDTFRTTDGVPVEAVSRDGGHTWPILRWMKRANGCDVKHIRAANFAWRCSNGKYLYWFHNHGGRRFIDVYNAWSDRNPVWLLPGVEYDSPEGRMIRWGEPEVLLYHEDLRKGMSYPDLMEDQGRYFFSETEKTVARTHEVPASFLQKMWDVLEGKTIAVDSPLLMESEGGKEIPPQALPELSGGNGFSFEIELAERTPGILFDSTGTDGRGIRIEYSENRRLVVTINDSRQEMRAVSESVPDLRKAVVIADGGPCILSFIADGRFLDGGDEFQFGWRRFPPQMRNNCPNSAPWRIGKTVKRFAVRSSALMTAEAVFLTRPRQ